MLINLPSVTQIWPADVIVGSEDSDDLWKLYDVRWCNFFPVCSVQLPVHVQYESVEQLGNKCDSIEEHTIPCLYRERLIVCKTREPLPKSTVSELVLNI